MDLSSVKLKPEQLSILESIPETNLYDLQTLWILEMLRRYRGNRIKACNVLKISPYTIRRYIVRLKDWGLSFPEDHKSKRAVPHKYRIK